MKPGRKPKEPKKITQRRILLNIMKDMPVVHSIDDVFTMNGILKENNICAEYASTRDDKNHYIIIKTRGSGTRFCGRISLFYEKVVENGETFYALEGIR